jgi:hypothetical protein
MGSLLLILLFELCAFCFLNGLLISCILTVPILMVISISGWEFQSWTTWSISRTGRASKGSIDISLTVNWDIELSALTKFYFDVHDGEWLNFLYLIFSLWLTVGIYQMGKLKSRIRPSDITINIGKDAPIPKCPIPGERFGFIQSLSNRGNRRETLL